MILRRLVSIFIILFMSSAYATNSFVVEKYKVYVEPSFANKSIVGSTEITVSGNTARVYDFPLYGLQVDSVQILNKQIPFTQEQSKLRIDLSNFKKVKSILIHYSGKPTKGLVWGTGYVYTNYDPCAWMICFEEPAVRAAIEIELKIPNGMQATANGDQTTNGKWRESRAYSSYLYGFAVGNFEIVTEKFLGFEAQYIGFSQSPDELKKKFKDTEGIVRFFEKKSGVAIPMKKYSQVLVPGNEAQEKQGFSILGTNFVDPILNDPSEDWVLVHELAHQWWGNLLTCKSWDHFWLNEGLTVFMTAAYKQNRWGQAAYDREMELAKKRHQNAIDAKFDVPLTFPGTYPSMGIKRAIVYSKGALFLDALRKEMGDKLFWKGIKDYTLKFQFKSVESKDFELVMEKAANKSLKPIFNHWVY